MKRLSSLSTSVLTALLVMPFAAVTAIADDGTWNTISSGNWSDSTKWSDSTIADGAGFTATFEANVLPNTTSPIVTIALDTDRTIGNLTFSGTASTGTHHFQVDGPGTLTLSAGTTPTITNSLGARNATINVTLAGSQGVSYITSGGATGTFIGGANTYTGLTQISGGGVTATNNLAFGGTADGTAIADGEGYVKLADGVTITGETLHAKGNGGKSNFGVLHTDTNAVAEWAGNIVLDTSVRIGANGSSAILTLSGVISDNDSTARNVAFSHGNDDSTNGTVVLSGANTYGGSTTVYRGTLKLDAGNNRLPTGTTLSIGGTVTDATVDLNGYDQTVADLTTGDKTSTRTLTNTSGSTSTFTVNKTSGSSTFAGVISGAINVIKTGNGTLNLTGTAHTFTGNISVEAGTLSLASAFIDDNADVSLFSGAFLDLNHTGTDSIARLFIDGLAQDAGIYGAIGSGADHERDFITGTGWLNVTSGLIPEPSTAAALTGLAALSLVALRRRHR